MKEIIRITDEKRKEGERSERKKKGGRIVRNTQVGDDYPSPEPILDSSRP